MYAPDSLRLLSGKAISPGLRFHNIVQAELHWILIKETVGEDSDAEIESNTKLAVNMIELSEISDLYEKVIDRRAYFEHKS